MIQLAVLHSKLRELDTKLALLDKKLSRLEKNIDNELFAVFLRAHQLDISLPASINHVDELYYAY